MIRGWERLHDLEPITRYVAGEFLAYLDVNGVSGTITSGRRTWWEQARLYYDWATGRSRIPAARPGTSLHELGLAFDFVPANYTPRDIQPITPYFWLRAGIDFRTADPVHYELHCAALWEAGFDFAVPECRQLRAEGTP